MCHSCVNSIPAHPGTQGTGTFMSFWIPAFGGMTRFALSRPLRQGKDRLFHSANMLRAALCRSPARRPPPGHSYHDSSL